MIKPDDIYVDAGHYHVKVYEMEADLDTPTEDQIKITTEQADNSLNIEVTNFEFSYRARLYMHAFIFSIHGYIDIDVKIEEIYIGLIPTLVKDGEYQGLGTKLKDVEVKIPKENIDVEKISLGWLPGFIARIVANKIKDTISTIFDKEKSKIETMITQTMDKYEKMIPHDVAISNTNLSDSLSLSNPPTMYDDRMEFDLDGSIFVTKDGFHVHSKEPKEMAHYDKDNKNNVQVFINPFVVDTIVESAREIDLRYTIDNDTSIFSSLPDDIMTVKYFDLIFPFMSCAYQPYDKVHIEIGFDQNLATNVEFWQDRLEGHASPNLRFYANNDHAFTLIFQVEFTASVIFKNEETANDGKGSIAHVNLTRLSIEDVVFEKGTIRDSDVAFLVETFKDKIQKAAEDAMSGKIIS